VKTGTDNKCRLCKQFYKTVEHIISACPIMPIEQYIKRHDRVRAQLHFNTRTEIWIKLKNEQWYDHVSKSVKTSRECTVTILWNQT
jgi:hypothetical protein